VYGSQRRWAEAFSGNQPFWQINFLLLLLHMPNVRGVVSI